MSVFRATSVFLFSFIYFILIFASVFHTLNNSYFLLQSYTHRFSFVNYGSHHTTILQYCNPSGNRWWILGYCAVFVFVAFSPFCVMLIFTCRWEDEIVIYRDVGGKLQYDDNMSLPVTKDPRIRQALIIEKMESWYLILLFC